MGQVSPQALLSRTFLETGEQREVPESKGVLGAPRK